MLAILFGDIAFLLGLALLLLPLLLTELSRPRDAVWGAVVLLLGLVLVTSNDRLRGAPTLAVLFSALLIGRLGFEVAQNRWQQLSKEEKERIGSRERWSTSFHQLSLSWGEIAKTLSGLMKVLVPQQKVKITKKKWVRPEKPVAETEKFEAESLITEVKGELIQPTNVSSQEQGASKDS